MQKLWIYLHFPQLQLDSLLQQASNDSTHTPAYVVIEPSHHQICQLNQQAYQAGIRLGMGLGTAAMLKHDLQVIEYQEKVSLGLLNDIAHHLYLRTSDISFWKHDGLILQVHNMLDMYGGLKGYWQTIQQALPQTITYQYATGLSPLMARILALTAWNTISQKSQKMQQAIQTLPLTLTELAPVVIKKLARVGVHQIQDLLTLPFAELAKRFDGDVTEYIGKLTNQIPHPLHHFHPKQEFSRYLELLFDIENTATVLKPLKLLLDALEVFLKNRDLLTQTLQIDLYLRDKSQVNLLINARQGEYLSATWQQLISLKIESIQLTAAVYAIELNTINSYIRSPEEQDFYHNKQGTLSRLQLLSLLQAKLGEQAITAPKLANDFRPELFTYNGPSNLNTTPHIKLQAMRPSFLLTPPQPLKEKVSIAYGPERIHTAWWDTKPVIRDYFIAYNSAGQWYWIYKTPSGTWYLHGVFS